MLTVIQLYTTTQLWPSSSRLSKVEAPDYYICSRGHLFHCTTNITYSRSRDILDNYTIQLVNVELPNVELLNVEIPNIELPNVES